MQFIKNIIYIDFLTKIFNLYRDIIITINITNSKTVKAMGYYYKAKHKIHIINLSFNINHLEKVIL